MKLSPTWDCAFPSSEFFWQLFYIPTSRKYCNHTLKEPSLCMTLNDLGLRTDKFFKKISMKLKRLLNKLNNNELRWIKCHRDQLNLWAKAGRMSNVVQYKINKIPCQILLRFVFVSILLWVFAFFFVCLSVFLLLACFTRDVWQPLTQIRLSLSLSLGVGQIVFLAGINATENAVSVVFIYLWFICILGAEQILFWK